MCRAPVVCWAVPVLGTPHMVPAPRTLGGKGGEGSGNTAKPSRSTSATVTKSRRVSQDRKGDYLTTRSVRAQYKEKSELNFEGTKKVIDRFRKIAIQVSATAVQRSWGGPEQPVGGGETGRGWKAVQGSAGCRRTWALAPGRWEPWRAEGGGETRPQPVPNWILPE